MSKLCRRVMLVGFVLLAPEKLMAGEPLDAQGNVGKTSYVTLPFQSDVYQVSWASSAGLLPMNLYYQVNPSSQFFNASTMAAAMQSATDLENSGIVPIGGAQRWEDTWEISQPATNFSGEPSYITNERNTACSGYSGNSGGTCTGQPEFVAWGNWITNHPQYLDTAFDGGTMPTESDYYRSWGSQWGHIEPDTPLADTDCSPAPTPCVYGDTVAASFGKIARLSGAYGLGLSDFSDSMPQRPANTHNFNVKRTTPFGMYIGQTIPGSTIAQRATWIVANKPNEWVDFTATGYANFFEALASQISSSTGKVALVIDQCGGTVAERRLYGLDQRIIASNMSPKSYLCGWDDQVIQTGRCGPINCPPMQELGGFVLAAAREPLLRNGANLEADDGDYWSAIAQFYPGLSSADQHEVGLKLLKRLWTWSAFAHIADRSGNVRRALAFVSRDYFDSGSLISLDPLRSVIQGVVPTKPFGAAIYYSDTLGRIIEAAQMKSAGAGINKPCCMYMEGLQPFLDAGSAGSGYYVSDAALGAIVKGSANAPFAWVVIDPTNQLPAAEQNKLAAIAPVVKSAAALGSLPGNPLVLPAGLTGFGFFDQSSRLIVVVSNPSTAPGASAVSGNISMSGTGYSNGSHRWTSLLTGASGYITISSGSGVLAQTVARWDTDVIAISPNHEPAP